MEGRQHTESETLPHADREGCAEEGSWARARPAGRALTTTGGSSKSTVVAKSSVLWETVGMSKKRTKADRAEASRSTRKEGVSPSSAESERESSPRGLQSSHSPDREKSH